MKKVLSLLLVLCLSLSVFAAVAEGLSATPSIKSDDLLVVDGDFKGTDFAIFVLKDEQTAPWYLPQVAAIGEFVTAGNPVMDCFTNDTVNEVKAQFAADTDMGSLVCYETMAVDAVNYKAEYGDIGVTGEFATVYPQDVDAAAIVGFCEGTNEDGTNQMKWFVLETEVLEDGRVHIIFGQEAMECFEKDGHCMMMIVSNPIE